MSPDHTSFVDELHENDVFLAFIVVVVIAVVAAFAVSFAPIMRTPTPLNEVDPVRSPLITKSHAHFSLYKKSPYSKIYFTHPRLRVN